MVCQWENQYNSYILHCISCPLVNQYLHIRVFILMASWWGDCSQQLTQGIMPGGQYEGYTKSSCIYCCQQLPAQEKVSHRWLPWPCHGYISILRCWIIQQGETLPYDALRAFQLFKGKCGDCIWNLQNLLLNKFFICIVSIMVSRFSMFWGFFSILHHAPLIPAGMNPFCWNLQESAGMGQESTGMALEWTKIDILELRV